MFSFSKKWKKIKNIWKECIPNKGEKLTDEQKIMFLALAKANLIDYINNEKLVNIIVYNCVDYLNNYSKFTLKNLDKFFNLVHRNALQIISVIETLCNQQFEDAYENKIENEPDFKAFISLKL